MRKKFQFCGGYIISLMCALCFAATSVFAAHLSPLGQVNQRMAALNSTIALAAQPQRDRHQYLMREVRHELLMLPYYGVFDWLGYEVRPNGDVVLRGQVTRPVTKSDAESAVKGIEGVGRVINEIQVLPLSPMDDQLRIALYRAIYGGELFHYAVGSLNPIHIIVSNGHVTLRGYVDTQADKNLAEIKAKSVPGVFSVENDLEVTGQGAR